MKIYAGITKIDPEQRMVFGYASTEALDFQNEIVRREAIEDALPAYMKFANIREMHQPSAVGTAKNATMDDKGLYLAVKVVDDRAWLKVKEGVYHGFSIGGSVKSRDSEDKRIITAVELNEISLVDRPANPEALIDVFKIARPNVAKAKLEIQASRARLTALIAKAKQDTTAKGMYEVAELSRVLSMLNYLAEASEYEEVREKDTASTIPARLNDALAMVGDILRDMVDEEVGELVDDEPDILEMAVTLGGLAKAGARHSKADKARLQAIHDHSASMGADCSNSTEKLSMEKEELKKLTDANAASLTKLGEISDVLKVQNDTLGKLADVQKAQAASIDAILKTVGEHSTAIKKFGDALVPTTISTRAIDKTQDSDADAARKRREADEKPTTDPKEMMKRAQRKPMNIDPLSRMQQSA